MVVAGSCEAIHGALVPVRAAAAMQLITVPPEPGDEEDSPESDDRKIDQACHVAQATGSDRSGVGGALRVVAPLC
jgi:hypothetical protein